MSTGLAQRQCRCGPASSQRHRARVRSAWSRATWTPRCAAGEDPQRSAEEPSTSGAGGSAEWWTRLNRRQGIRGPDEAPTSPSQGLLHDVVGDRMSRRMEQITKEERQRVWDAMRAAAGQRYADGRMPDWFDPSWLQQQEAPINAIMRQDGHPLYQSDEADWPEEAWGGGDGASGNGGDDGSPPSGSGGGWWREEDPYWPLRQWGDHPMRWWTLGFAAVMAVGGLATSLATGCGEAVQLGCGAGVLLALAGGAMSVADSTPGAAGVKLAWAVCAALVAKEALGGWQHKRGQRGSGGLGLTGWAALALCVGYMATDMSGLGEVALPDNPGAVFKSPDVALRSSVWRKWGYGDVTMRV